jgi:hypothetical protein
MTSPEAMQAAEVLTPPLMGGAKPSAGGRLVAFVRSFPFVLFVATRLAYVAMSWMGLTAIPFLFYHDNERQRALQPYPWIDGLCRWDCGWFHNVAVNGYATVEYAKVFPLLGALGGAMEKYLGVNHLVAFILIANACALGAYAVIYALFKELEGEDAARAGLMLFAAFPFAFFQAAGYPESIMVLATAWSIALARKQKHLRSGLVLTVGFAARHLTLAGGIALLVAQLRQRGFKRFFLSPAWLALLLPWSFLAGFSFYLGQKFGDPLAWWNARRIGWNDWVWYGARQVLLYVPYAERPEYFFYLIFSVVVIAGAGGLLWALLKRRWEYAEISAFGLLLLAVVLSTGAAGMGRYLASIWPCFLPLGVWLSKRQALLGPVLGFLWLCQGMWFFLFSHQWRVL